MYESFVTIAKDDISSIECLVLCNSLKKTGTDKLISVIINPSVSYHLRSVLQKSFDKVYDINDLNLNSDNWNKFDYLGDYEKLKIWLLSDFTKCVFLESDVLVVENIDDLFDRLELSAASDPRWPDCFDAGVFVFQPSPKTYKLLIEYSIANPSPDNSFQCLLNMFFCDWNIITMSRKIPFIYNCQMNATFYTHTTALVHFGHSIKAARMGHQIFNLMQPDSTKCDINQENWSRLWNTWWKIFNEMVKPAINNDNSLNFQRRGCDYDVKENTNQVNTSTDQQFNPASQPLNCLNQPLSEGNTTSPVFINLSSNVESICPSQDFNITEGYHEPCVQTISQEESVETTDILAKANMTEPVVSGSIVDIVDEETTNEELGKTNRLRWERGEIDYMGQDSFENILVKLNSVLVASSDEENLDNLEE